LTAEVGRRTKWGKETRKLRLKMQEKSSNSLRRQIEQARELLEIGKAQLRSAKGR